MGNYKRVKTTRKKVQDSYKRICQNTGVNWKIPDLKPGDTPGNYIMPTGRWQSLPISSVPAWHLLWLYENDKCNPEQRNYIERNFDRLRVLRGVRR